jgi:uncharacterized protein YidB (DUF937 family)
MGILDGVVGGLVSAGVVSLVSNVIEQHGGVQGLVSQFEQKGLGSIIQSWVGTGANQAISSNQIQQVLDNDLVKTLAEKTGISTDELAAKIAEILPDAVDKLTPNGTVAAAA